MIRQVGDSGLVSGGVVGNLDGVFVSQLVGNMRGQRAGIPFFAVHADVGKFHGRPVRHFDGFRLPYFSIEANFAAVQGIRPVVQKQRVFLAVKGELSLRDAIAVTADRGAEVRLVTEIAVQLVKAEHDVSTLAGFVRYPQFSECCAIRDDLRDAAFRVLQRILLDLGSVGQFAERGFLHVVRLDGFAALRAQSPRNQNHGKKHKQRHAAKFHRAVHIFVLLDIARRKSSRKDYYASRRKYGFPVVLV